MLMPRSKSETEYTWHSSPSTFSVMRKGLCFSARGKKETWTEYNEKLHRGFYFLRGKHIYSKVIKFFLKKKITTTNMEPGIIPTRIKASDLSLW